MVQCNSTTLLARITCPDTHKLCGNKLCYDPATHFCSEISSVVICINTCGQKCYDSASQHCISRTVCTIGEDLCEVKYDTYSGNPIEPTRLQCYNPRSQRCLNHTLCYEKDRVCNGQCILYTSRYQHQICANDNKTLCEVSLTYNNYKPNQIQVCNGSCFDVEKRPRQHCLNGILQRISNCSNTCYDKDQYVCLNGFICPIGSEICESGSAGQCYDPLDYKCLNGTVCSNNRACGGQCISNSYQVCANDKRTVCNVTSYYGSYRPYQMHMCNGKCFDTSLQQCINGVVSCIDDICGGQCYNSAFYVCLNNTLCSVREDLCEVKYDSSSGNPIEPIRLQCYNPRSQKCLNHTLCYQKDRVCNGQCILYTSSYQYQICANDNKTLCRVPYEYTKYEPNRIQVCNGSCFDVGKPPLYHCLNGTVQCISSCSNICYNKDQNVCLNGTVCSIGSELCESGSARQCYNPLSYKCLNGIVCSNDRACDGQCISNNYQVCANDKKTVCNVARPYNNYRPNQIQLCLGVCYDSSVQQCSGANMLDLLPQTT